MKSKDTQATGEKQSQSLTSRRIAKELQVIQEIELANICLEGDPKEQKVFAKDLREQMKELTCKKDLQLRDNF